MRDVTFALGAAAPYKPTLSKISLQKFIYLLDVVAILYDLFPSANGHVTYTYGPYDPTIQSAVDSLAFRGLALILSSRVHGGGVSADYALTHSGRTWCEHLAAENAFQLRWLAARDIAARLDVLGWARVVELVYAEPTFVFARTRGIGRHLHPAAAEADSASALLRFVRQALTRAPGTTPSRALLMDLFFGYLDEYASRAVKSRH
jgi:hypothetical protein